MRGRRTWEATAISGMPSEAATCLHHCEPACVLTSITKCAAHVARNDPPKQQKQKLAARKANATGLARESAVPWIANSGIWTLSSTCRIKLW